MRPSTSKFQKLYEGNQAVLRLFLFWERPPRCFSVHRNLVSNSWFYCDTLGWNPPSDLKKEINRVLEAINNIHCSPKKHFKNYFNCHMPSSADVYHHKWSSKCFKNFPFQTCGNVCGVIVAILAVVAQKIPNIWQNVIISQTGTLPSGLKWLLEPTTYSDYLREVIISWFVKGETNVAFIENCLKNSPVLKVMEDIEPFMGNPIVANVAQNIPKSVAHPPVLNVLEDPQQSMAQPTVEEETQSYVAHPSVCNVVNDTQQSVAHPTVCNVVEDAQELASHTPAPNVVEDTRQPVVYPAVLKVLEDTQQSVVHQTVSNVVDETQSYVAHQSFPNVVEEPVVHPHVCNVVDDTQQFKVSPIQSPPILEVEQTQHAVIDPPVEANMKEMQYSVKDLDVSENPEETQQSKDKESLTKNNL